VQTDALAQLAALDHVDAGLLCLAANASAVLVQLEVEAAATVAPEPGDRALVVDDNMTVQIVVYSADRCAAAATLSPAAATRLAGELISLAYRRL
jgi:hypothetical protein